MRHARAACPSSLPRRSKRAVERAPKTKDLKDLKDSKDVHRQTPEGSRDAATAGRAGPTVSRDTTAPAWVAKRCKGVAKAGSRAAKFTTRDTTERCRGARPLWRDAAEYS